MKFFNTAGPVNRPDYYKIDPLARWDFDEIMMLIKRQRYFILHAPRQTGKTSCLLALRDYLNERDEYFALYINVEAGQAARHDVGRVIKATVAEIRDRLSEAGISSEITQNMMELYAQTEEYGGLRNCR
jgi:hypothetical protein